MVLELLNWDLSAITPYCILDQLLRRLIQPLHNLRGHFHDLQSIRSYAETLLSLAMTEMDFLTTSPCLVAVAALITSMSSLNNQQNSSQNAPEVAVFLQNLFHLTGINLEETAGVITNLETIVRARIAFEQQSNTSNSCNNNVYGKISSSKTLVKASTTCVC